MLSTKLINSVSVNYVNVPQKQVNVSQGLIQVVWVYFMVFSRFFPHYFHVLSMIFLRSFRDSMFFRRHFYAMPTFITFYAKQAVPMFFPWFPTLFPRTTRSRFFHDTFQTDLSRNLITLHSS